MHIQNKTRGITPERAQQILLENGVKIDLAKAALVLDFMYEFAILEVNKIQEK